MSILSHDFIQACSKIIEFLSGSTPTLNSSTTIIASIHAQFFPRDARYKCTETCHEPPKATEFIDNGYGGIILNSIRYMQLVDSGD